MGTLELKIVSILVSVLLVNFVKCEEEITVRLSGGKYFEGGYVEIWRDGSWGLLCDKGRNTWTKNSADVLCRHLGFSGSLQKFHGDTQLWSIPQTGIPATDRISCSGQESSLSRCSLSYARGCSTKDVVSVLCEPESKSACGPNSVAALGNCYTLVQDKKTFPHAQEECQKLSGNLVEIESPLENNLIGMVVEKSSFAFSSYWTGGVINEIFDSKIKTWHGSQKPIVYDNDYISDGNMDRPKGLIFNFGSATRYPQWKTFDFENQLPFICKFKQQQIGCLGENDPTGSKYVGPAMHSKDGNICAPWNTATGGEYSFTDSFCRNPDEDESPYCYLKSGEPSYCNIPMCSKVVPKAPEFNLCGSTQQNNQITSKCFKEEYTCKNGDCISKDFVCDGVKDCENGDDEEGCRSLSTMFVRDDGFKLEGVPINEFESVQASLEDCAKMCLYRRMIKYHRSNEQCCDSFSHRPGKDGRDDRCTLGTIYNNNDFDGMIEKKSWNYYKLNSTTHQYHENCRSRLPRNTKGPIIEGLRLRNRRKSVDGNLIQIKINGEWGGICDDGFNLNEANVVCKQLGFKQGALRIVKGANVDGKGGNIVLGTAACNGSELSLGDCSLSTKAQCHPRYMVAVQCSTAEAKCKEHEYQCRSGECIKISGLCNGVINECRDNSDESPQLCRSKTDVRLTSPGEQEDPNPLEGILEVRHKGVWGSVCGAFFGQEEANVFCKMLGHDRAETGGWREAYGEHEGLREGSWPIWINFHEENPCSGSESSIEQCHNKDLWVHDGICEHNEDIILTCKTDDSLRRLSTREVSNFPVTKQVVENCGLWRKTSDVHGQDARIVGGLPVRHGTLPWQATIRLRGPDGKTYHNCGAVIISPFHVLTTAHCMYKFREQLNIYYVRVGDNIMEIPDDEEQELSIEKVDFHENYGVGLYLNNDIAVVHIDKTKHTTGIQFGDKVLPVCLPQATADYSANNNVTVSGWGQLGNDDGDQRSGTNFVSQLQMVSFPIIDSQICKKPEVYGNKISSGMFCAGLLEGGLDTCQGDSGGPAVSYVILPNTNEVRATLMGLVSWGYGCGRENAPGVYTKVSKYVDWIYAKVQQQ